jgi:hypothetical protein
MKSVRDSEWRQFPLEGVCNRHVGHEAVARGLAAYHLIAKSIKKLP